MVLLLLIALWANWFNSSNFLSYLALEMVTGGSTTSAAVVNSGEGVGEGVGVGSAGFGRIA